MLCHFTAHALGPGKVQNNKSPMPLQFFGKCLIAKVVQEKKGLSSWDKLGDTKRPSRKGTDSIASPFSDEPGQVTPMFILPLQCHPNSPWPT